MTFAPNNLAEIEAMRALTKTKPVVSRAEQSEVLRNKLSVVLDEATAAGFVIKVSILRGDTVCSPETIRMVDARGAR